LNFYFIWRCAVVFGSCFFFVIVLAAVFAYVVAGASADVVGEV